MAPVTLRSFSPKAATPTSENPGQATLEITAATPSASVDTLDATKRGAPALATTPAPPNPLLKRSLNAVTPQRAPTAIMAQIGDVAISAEDIRSLADTMERQAALVATLQEYAAANGIAYVDGESETEFYDRVCDELSVIGSKPSQLESLDEALAAVVSKSELQTFMDLVDNENLRRALANFDLQSIVDLPLVEQNAFLRETLSYIAGGGDAVETFLTDQMEVALWAPHEAVLAPFTAGMDTDMAAQFKRLLANAYGRSMDAPSLVANDLQRKNSAAAEIARLVKTSGAVTWTYADLQAAAQKDASLLPLQQKAQATLGIDDGFIYGATPVTLTAGGSGALVQKGPRVEQPVFKSVKQQTLAFVWTQSADGSAFLAVAAPEGQKTPSLSKEVIAQAQNTMVAAIEALGPKVGTFFDTDGPSFAQILKGQAMLPFLGEPPSELVLGHPDVAAALEISFVRALCSGGDVARLSKKIDELPALRREHFRALLARMPALAAIQPLPLVLTRTLLGGAPTIVGAKDEGESKDVLEAIGLWAQASAVIPPNLDAAQAARKLLEPMVAKDGTLSLDALTLTTVLGNLASALDVQPSQLGDLVALHPVISAYKAKGGKADPLSLVTLYLKDQGFGVDPPPSNRLVTSLMASLKKPLDQASLDRVSTELLTQTAPSRETLRAVLGAKFLVLPARPPRVVMNGACNDAEWSALLGRLKAKAEPAVERTYDRADFGLLAENEPIVALKLFAASQSATSLRPGASGEIDGTLDASELRTLRDIVCAPALESANPLYASFSLVADSVAEGKLVLASLNDDGKGDVGVVINALRQISEVMRQVSIQTSRASVAVENDLQRSAWLEIFPDALARAATVMRGSAVTGAVSLQASDLDALAARANTEPPSSDERVMMTHARFLKFFSKEDAGVVREGLSNGSLTIDEGGVHARPVGGAMEAAAHRLLDAYLAAADVSQSAKRVADEGVEGRTRRAFLSAANHLATLPGFTDPEAIGAASSWLAVTLKLERARAQGIALSPGTDPKSIAAFQLSLSTVTADDLDFVAANYGELLGKSTVDSLIAGVPDTLPDPKAAKTMIEKIARKMRSGELPAWPSLDPLLSDLDPEVRLAKKLVGRALMRKCQDGGDTSAIAAAKSSFLALLAIEPMTKARKLKAMLVYSGERTAAQTNVTNDTLSVEELRAAAALLKKRAAEVPTTAPAEKRALLHAAEVLNASAAKGETSLSMLRPGEALTNAVTIAADAVTPPAPRAAPGAFDAASLLMGVNKVVIRSPLTNVVPQGSTTDHVLYDLGRNKPMEEQTLDKLSAWTKKVKFDPSRAIETSISTYILYEKFMGTMIAYELSVVPMKRTANAIEAYWNATDDDQRRAAVDQIWQAWSTASDSLAMFTAFHTPVGFAQELIHDVERGDLDVAAGKAVVTVPIMRATYKALASQASAARDFIVYRNKPYKLVEASMVNAESTVVMPKKSGLVRRAVQRTYGTTVAALDMAISPAKTLWAPVRKMRELSTRAFKSLTRPRIGLAADGSVKVSFTPEQKLWLRNDMARGGYGSVAITLEQTSGGATRTKTVTLTTQELKALSGKGGTKVTTEVSVRLGLSAKDNQGLVSALGEALPAQTWTQPVVVSQNHVRPSLSVLARDGAEMREWTMTTASGSKVISVRNSTLVKLVHQHFGGNPAGYLRTAKEAGFDDTAALTDLVSTFGRESLGKMRSADRSAFIGDLGSRLELIRGEVCTSMNDFVTRAVGPSAATKRLVLADVLADARQFNLEALSKGFAESFGRPMKNGKLLLNTTVDGLAIRVIEDSKGNIRVRSGRADISNSNAGRAVVETFNKMKKDFGTTSLKAADALRVIVDRAKAYSVEAEAGLLVGSKLQDFTKWAKEADRALQNAGEAAPKLRQRCNIEFIRAKIVASDFRAAFKSNGLSGVTIKVFESTARTLKNEMKEPSFYLVVALAGKEVLVDMGHVMNDSTLTSMEKLKASLVSVGVNAGAAGLGIALLSLGKRFAPRFAKGANQIGAMLLAVDAMSGKLVEDLGEVASSLAGYQDALPAMLMWQSLGIPEAMYLRIDPSKYQKTTFFEDRTNDVGSLEGQHDTLRTAYWYTNDSPLHQRLRQILGQAIDTKSSPVRQVTNEFLEAVDDGSGKKSWQLRTDVLGRMTKYKEPVWPAVRWLEQKAPADFSMDDWRSEVRGVAKASILKIADDEGTIRYNIDLDKVRDLLLAQDMFTGASDRQQCDLRNRIKGEMFALEQWFSMLMISGVPNDQKEAALVQLIENMAANHRVNLMMYAANSQAPGEVTAQDHISDFYLFAK